MINQRLNNLRVYNTEWPFANPNGYVEAGTWNQIFKFAHFEIGFGNTGGKNCIDLSRCV